MPTRGPQSNRGPRACARRSPSWHQDPEGHKEQEVDDRGAHLGGASFPTHALLHTDSHEDLDASEERPEGEEERVAEVLQAEVLLEDQEQEDPRKTVSSWEDLDLEEQGLVGQGLDALAWAKTGAATAATSRGTQG